MTIRADMVRDHDGLLLTRDSAHPLSAPSNLTTRIGEPGGWPPPHRRLSGRGVHSLVRFPHEFTTDRHCAYEHDPVPGEAGPSWDPVSLSLTCEVQL